ncbi:hypothetical protein LUZ63_001582 [Rhynchospora breviuscula]|uniref:Uncharacterized protein n=1 Tax=Rhynchospora breviuscula TaxID=2022672 RepID=A0A9Q0HY05_9POAL|nr:hypothetical protein LUZ63_001582 [Rhynchospora breviuscula]
MVLYRELYSGINKPKTRIVNKLQTVPTTKFMTRVSSKPTNHSRYTSKWTYGCGCPLCSNCSWPTNKSRSKAKGTHKLRHRADVAVNHLLVSQRLVGSSNRAHWVRFDCGSANWLLSQLTYDDYGDLDIDCHDEHDDDYESYDKYWHDNEVGETHGNGLTIEKQEAEVDMGFCFVEFIRVLDDEDAWCLIGDF